MTLFNGSKIFSKALLALTMAAGVMANANASITFQYTGNPFSASQSTPGMSGKHIVASVTFNDSVSGFTGVARASEVLSWNIGIANTAIQFNSTANVGNSSWPLWFSFENGAITGWQLLAKESSANQYPEVYTTHNSPYSRIYPTADYFDNRASNLLGLNMDTPGVWAPVPEAETSLMLSLGLALLCAPALKRRLNTAK